MGTTPIPSASGIAGAVYVHGVRADLDDDDLRLLLLIARTSRIEFAAITMISPAPAAAVAPISK